ncbi:uroporphyrinogen decarboxylase family protein [Sunxiuqinia rutila]|uniref:uroporphyrinogen decarboxylase family protein n=1 Tax=Sunxiuqinia rutila TaxID=1397841 RepID=UPI003D35C1F3
MERSNKCLGKLTRMNMALSHQEPDRVPISDFFWGSFVKRWRKELNLPDDASPYTYYDLDWIVTMPNMDPKIQSFETIKEDGLEVIVKTGFRTTMRKKFDFPMPEFISWEVDTIEKLEKFEFDDPYDKRRYFEAGDNQIAGVGDGFERNSPAWIDTVKKLHPDFPVYGSIIECSECLTRLLGQENTLFWMGMYSDQFGVQINRIGQFYLDCMKAQIKAADGLLDGMVIWGDVAYKQTMLFDPEYWRMYFKPWVKAMIEECHKNNLPVIYHGCGNVELIFEDFIEMGLDAYNPLEVKANMDAVELKKKHGNKIGYCGNNNIQVWETDDKEQIRKEVLFKLNAAKGGGYIFQSDHSVSSDVSGQSYDYIVKLVREHGKYPLHLKEFDETI